MKDALQDKAKPLRHGQKARTAGNLGKTVSVGKFLSAINQDNDVEHAAGCFISIALWKRELHQMGDTPQKPEKKFKLRRTKLFPAQTEGTLTNSSVFELVWGCFFFTWKVISAIQ